MLVFFVLLTLIVQIGFLVLARNAVAVGLEAAVRRGGVTGEDLGAARDRLSRDLSVMVPGSSDIEIDVRSDGRTVTGVVSFDWTPPGPDLVPIRVSVTRQASVVVPP